MLIHAKYSGNSLRNTGIIYYDLLVTGLPEGIELVYKQFCRGHEGGGWMGNVTKSPERSGVFGEYLMWGLVRNV